MRRACAALLLLAACSQDSVEVEDLTPAMARAYGVGVQDGAGKTGTVIAEHFATFQRIDEACGGQFGTSFGGCSIRVAPHEYVIWYADRECIRVHELAHSVFESIHHTGPYLQRSNAGDWLAACPRT